MPVTLDQILSSTRGSLPGLAARREAIERELRDAPPPPPFGAALCGASLAVIAEVKRRSPSAGAIRPDLDPAGRAAVYAGHGASAISVLTDGPFFGGSMADLRAVAGSVTVPVLRKDFILDELQILEARAAGAAAVLLIVRALGLPRLATLARAAAVAGLETVVEVHTPAELDLALEAGARVIGVNSRDLDSFAIDTAAAWTLLGRIPADRIAVAESGMASVADVQAAAEAGADAVLVGTALSVTGSPADLLDALVRTPRRER